MIERLLSFWENLFSGVMIVSGTVLKPFFLIGGYNIKRSNLVSLHLQGRSHQGTIQHAAKELFLLRGPHGACAKVHCLSQDQ